jgi:hypothetical protein
MFVTISTLKSSNGFSAPIQLDYMKLTALAVQTVVDTTGAGLTYSVEYSLDALTSASSVGMTWFSTGSSNLSTHAFISLATPLRALRFNITAGTSNTALTGTVLESFI